MENQVIKVLNEEPIFKVGDKVYHFTHGWGIIGTLDSFVTVSFNDKKIHFNHNTQLLSFTEYTLQGFSQERPIELPKVGELCLVRNEDNDFWRVREFEFMNDGFWVEARWGSSECFKQMKRIKILD